MSEQRAAEDAGLIVEGIAEISNQLFRVVDPVRFGELSPGSFRHLAALSRDVWARIATFRGSASPGLDLSVLAEILIELEVLLEADGTQAGVDLSAVASRLVSALGWRLEADGERAGR